MSTVVRYRALALAAGLLLAQLPAVTSAQSALVTFRVLAPETALEMAQAAKERCREDGFQVSVAVVDRMGVVQVLLRDRFAGPHANDSALRKAWTAASFRNDTLTLAAGTEPGSTLSGVREIDNVLMLGGGIPVEVSGSVVGAIGIAGALSAEADHLCAQAGIDAVAAQLELAE